MYTALRTMKVQSKNGEMRTVQRGDPVPEAAGWPNVRHYLNRNYLCFDTEFERLTGKPAQTPARTPATPEPESPVDDAAESEEALAVAMETHTSASGSGPSGPPTMDAPGPSESEIRSMNKTDLQALAESRGLSPDQTKKELVAAILRMGIPTRVLLDG